MLTDGLISYWKMDEASGNRVDSVVASANDLTSNNTVGQGTGKIVSAAQFNKASSRYLSHASNASLQCGDIDFTFAGWINLDSNPASGQYVILGKDTDSPASSRDYAIDYLRQTSSDFRLRFYLSGGTGLVQIVALNLTGGTWYFFRAWHDSVGNTLNLQVNNGTVTSAADGSTFDNSSAEFQIGARAFSTSRSFFDGRIDEVGFWKRVLTSTEGGLLYNNGAGLTYPFAVPRSFGTGLVGAGASTPGERCFGTVI